MYLIKIALVVTLLFSPVASANSQLQNLFSSGMKHAAEGDYNAAIAEFHKILATDSSLLRPRLELALALYKNEDYTIAKHHFEYVLASGAPQNVRDKVNMFLSKIRQELPIISMSVELISDYNPTQESSSETVTIGGFEYKINNSYNDKIRYGYSVTTSAKVPLKSVWRSYLNVVLQHSDYAEVDNEATYLSASLGKHYRISPRQTISPEVGFHHFLYRNHSLYKGRRFSLNYLNIINDTSSVNLDWNSSEMDYEDYLYLNGWQHKIAARYTKVGTSNSRWDIQATYLKANLEDKSSSFNQTGLSMSRKSEWGKGWVAGANLEVRSRAYQAISPFFGLHREDLEKTITLSLLNRRLQIYNFSPQLSLVSTKNNSNVSLYEFDRSYVKIGLSKEF